MPTLILQCKSQSLILKVIINRRALILANTLLLPIHLRHLPTTRRLIRLLIIPNLNKPREPQRDAFLTALINALFASSLVSWAECEIGGLDLPDVFWLEPDVGLVLVA